MAAEITYSGSLSVTKSSVTESMTGAAAANATLSGTKYVKNIQNVGIAEEALQMGDVTSPGWAIFKNLDATNFVSIRAATGAANLIKLLAGESAGPFRLIATAPYVIADTAACNLQYLIYEA